jgi:hypothetical protein
MNEWSVLVRLFVPIEECERSRMLVGVHLEEASYSRHGALALVATTQIHANRALALYYHVRFAIDKSPVWK